jgi:hypothetical protein
VNRDNTSRLFDFSPAGFYIKDNMKISNTLICALMPLMCAGWLQAQSLTELAKREKARRAKLKGKKSVVITNADLKKMDFKPGLTSRPLMPEAKTSETPRDPSPPEPKSPPSGKSQTPGTKLDQAEPSAAVIELEEEWKRANDTVGFLNLKLGGLWQQYYSGAAVSMDQLQAQIGLTYLELQNAQKKAEKLKLELEAAKKKKSP